jgi:hypothetical protein
MVIHWSTTKHKEDCTNTYKIQGSHSGGDGGGGDDNND